MSDALIIRPAEKLVVADREIARIVIRQEGVRGLNAESDIGFSVGGVLSPGEVFLLPPMPRPGAWSPADCLVAVDAAPTADAHFGITLDGISWGQAVVLAGHLTGSLTAATPTYLAAQRFGFVMPNPADTTLRGFAVTFVAAG